MSKKWIVSLSLIGVVIAVMLTLFWTLFALSEVEVEFESTKSNVVVTDEEIVEAGRFNIGVCVLFEGKKKAVENINNFAKENENFAYLKVINIETVFPNRFVVHVTEREELFAVEHDGQVLICDREFRVLRIEQIYQSTQRNAIVLKNLEIKNEQVGAGDFLEIEQEGMFDFYSAMVKNNRDLQEQIGKFQELSLGTNIDEFTGEEFVSLTMTSFAGREYIINNIDFCLAEKMQKLFATESYYLNNIDSSGNVLDKNGNAIYVVKLDSGELAKFDEMEHEQNAKFALTEIVLANCSFKVDNLPLTEYVERTAKDIYCALVHKGDL